MEWINKESKLNTSMSYIDHVVDSSVFIKHQVFL